MTKNITEDYIKKSIEYLADHAKDFPEGGINYFFNDIKFKSCDIEKQTIEYTVNVPETATNRIGVAHGGYQAGVADELMGWTLHIIKATKGFIATTESLSFDYLKAVPLGVTLTGKVSVKHAGKRSAITTCELYVGDKLCTMATEHWTVLSAGEAAGRSASFGSTSGNAPASSTNGKVFCTNTHIPGSIDVQVSDTGDTDSADLNIQDILSNLMYKGPAHTVI